MLLFTIDDSDASKGEKPSPIPSCIDKTGKKRMTFVGAAGHYGGPTGLLTTAMQIQVENGGNMMLLRSPLLLYRHFLLVGFFFAH